MATDNRSGKEHRTGKAARALGVVEVRHRTIRTRLIQPQRHTLENNRASLIPRDRHGKKLPVGFRIQVSAIKRQAVALADGEVPVALELVDVLGDEAGCGVVFWGIWLDGFLAAVFEVEGVRVERG